MSSHCFNSQSILTVFQLPSLLFFFQLFFFLPDSFFFPCFFSQSVIKYWISMSSLPLEMLSFGSPFNKYDFSFQTSATKHTIWSTAVGRLALLQSQTGTHTTQTTEIVVAWRSSFPYDCMDGFSFERCLKLKQKGVILLNHPPTSKTYSHILLCLLLCKY